MHAQFYSTYESNNKVQFSQRHCCLISKIIIQWTKYIDRLTLLLFLRNWTVIVQCYHILLSIVFVMKEMTFYQEPSITLNDKIYTKVHTNKHTHTHTHTHTYSGIEYRFQLMI